MGKETKNSGFLPGKGLEQALESILRGAEVDAFFVRREILIKLLEDRVAEVGESKVFYD